MHHFEIIPQHRKGHFLALGFGLQGIVSDSQVPHGDVGGADGHRPCAECVVFHPIFIQLVGIVIPYDDGFVHILPIDDEAGGADEHLLAVFAQGQTDVGAGRSSIKLLLQVMFRGEEKKIGHEKCLLFLACCFLSIIYIPQKGRKWQRKGRNKSVLYINSFLLDMYCTEEKMYNKVERSCKFAI